MKSITRGHLFAGLITALFLYGVTPTPGVAESIYLEEFPDPEDAMISNQIVAIKTPGLEYCPQPYQGKWQISQPLEAIGGVMSPDSSTFCLYEGEDASQIDALVNDDLLVRYGMNMATVVGAGTEVLKPKIWRSLLTHFESQAGKVPLTIIPGKPKVRLAVIDTTPTQSQTPWQVPGRSGHGHSLLNMARNLLCSTPTGDCISDLTSRLALTYYLDPADGMIHNDPIGGGEFGGFVELAQAINREVAAWVDEAPNSRLILNLSIGWDGRYGGLENQASKMPAPVEMVYNAVTDAACRGALIITAAGNDVGGPTPGDAWLPAQWGNRTRPDQATCEAKLGTSLDPANFPSGINVPLLYRFSGLRWDGEPLSNAIAGTESQLTFYADHAVAEYPTGTPTRILTGSSVSALVASATAAAVSYYWPSPPYPKIMETIYQAGTDMLRPAELCQGIDCPDNNMGPQVHLGSMCSALTALCTTVPECPNLQPCDPLGSEAPGIVFQELYDDFISSTPTPPLLNARDLTGGHVPPSLCDVDEQNFRLDLGIPANPCPERQRFSELIRPWVREGPGDVPCPSCAFERIGGGTGGRLLIEIGQSWTEQLTEPTLVACGNSYRLPLLTGAPLTGGSKMIVENVGVTTPCLGPMKLTFTVRGQLSSTDPILVLP